MLTAEGRNPSTMRLLYYPPVPPEDVGPCCQTDAVHYTRCGAHADYGTFTLLAQDSEGGLEVRNSVIYPVIWSTVEFKILEYTSITYN